MSKLSMLICWAFVALALAVFADPVRAQAIEATIEVDTGSNPIARVQGRFSRDWTKNRRNFSLLRSVAGVDNLAARVSEVELFDGDKNPISFKKLADGEYLSEADIGHFSYKVALVAPKARDAAAHVSWLSGDTGILMLADLLPVTGTAWRSAKIRIGFPSTYRDPSIGPSPWPVFTTEREVDSAFTVSNIDDAMFYFGSDWVFPLRIPRPPIEMTISGVDWKFEADDAVAIGAEIYEAYSKTLGAPPRTKPLVAIAKFPQQTAFGQWQAETRGRNVTIISSDMPFKQQSVQRLHEQLRHELFHLWIPNGVNLTGAYDWFYEGFALYESLKLAVAVNRITFADFLDTLSRAHTIDSANSQRVSLIQASANRFGGNKTQVYARGMLVAFLVDLELMSRSKGKRSVEDVLKELYAKHRKPAEPVDGNQAVLELLKANAGVEPIVKRYVTGSENIDWLNELAVAGISDSDPGPITTLKVDEKLNGRQKTLLDKLGYNNWRKLAPSSK